MANRNKTAVCPTPSEVCILLCARDGGIPEVPRWCVVAEHCIVRGWLGSRTGVRRGAGIVWNGHLLHVTDEGRRALRELSRARLDAGRELRKAVP